MEDVASYEMIEMAEGFAQVKQAMLDAEERGEREHRDDEATGRISNAMAKRRRKIYTTGNEDVPYGKVSIAVPTWPYNDSISAERRGEARRTGCYCAITTTLGVTGKLEGLVTEQTPKPNTPTLHVVLTRYGAPTSALVRATAQETGPTARLIDPQEALCATPRALHLLKNGGSAKVIDQALGDAMRATTFATEDAVATGWDTILVWNCGIGGPPDLEALISKARETGYHIALAIQEDDIEATHRRMEKMRDGARDTEAGRWYAAHIVDESDRLYAHLAVKLGGKAALRYLKPATSKPSGKGEDG